MSIQEPRTQRPEWLARALHEYEQVEDFIGSVHGVCVYCGEPANHRDHLVPKHYSGYEWRRYVPTVPACESCNVTLSDALVIPISDRCAHLAKRLRKKHHQMLKRGISGDEVAELAGELRKFAEARIAARQVLQQRLAILELGGAPNVDPSLFKD